MNLLELKDIGYRYDDALENEYVLRHLDYQFVEGKCYAIKGKSGSGKTTLLSLLAGLEKQTEGEILFEGKNLTSMDLDQYRSNEIGIIFQSFNLLPHLTATENILLSMDISKVKVTNKLEKAHELLESVGLTKEQGKRRVLKLSGGEQQRVAIARSLSYDPKIILADEPTGNLDTETENDIMAIFKRLAHDENKCVIIVTHSKNVANNVDEIIELNKKKSVK